MQLPREIRDMIWTEVLGGYKVNIHISQDGPYTRNSRCLSHTLCMKASSRISSASRIKELKECGQLVIDEDGFIVEDRVDEAVGRENMSQSCCGVAHLSNGGNILCVEGIEGVSFLSICAQIRDEAEPILYANTMFCFNGLGVLQNFLYHRTLSQLQQIQGVSLVLEEPFDLTECLDGGVWKHTIPSSTMLQMKRLKTLKLGINRAWTTVGEQPSTYEHDWTHIRTYVLFPLKPFRLCPLERVEASVGLRPTKRNASSHVFSRFRATRNQARAAAFPKERRDKVAEGLKKWLLDPAGKANEMEKVMGE